jgi:hypothetical protein
MVEGDLGEAAADATGSIRDLDLLDLADRLLEIVLSRCIRG